VPPDAAVDHSLSMRRFHVSDYRQYRLLEILPGALVWATFVLAIVLSFVVPLWVIGFIIVFDFFWLVRVLYILGFLMVAFTRFRRDERIDWLARTTTLLNWQRLHHLIVVPTFRESREVLDTTFRCLTESTYPLDSMIVVLACEERDRENATSNGEWLRERYGHRFRHFLVTIHPSGRPGEMPGKGSNIAWAGRRAKEWIDEQGLVYDDIVVSSFDADTCVHPHYFSYLSYTYLTHPAPTRTSYQPIPLFNNNIWDAPALMRVVANSTTFWLMSETLRPDRLFTFSSHSMSFRALVDVDFWQDDIVTEDSRIFLQCLIRYDGNYTVTPMYIPLSMDTVLGATWQRSLVNQYKQQRRWAYGVENFPYMVWNFRANPLIPLGKKIKYIWNQVEGVYSWATAPILIFILGRLPLWVANQPGSPIRDLAIVQTAPELLLRLMQAAMIGLLVSALLSTIILPPRPKRHHWLKFPLMLLQWVLFPITMVAFGSIPATEAQTRLMLGKYLGFWVTEKARHPATPPTLSTQPR